MIQLTFFYGSFMKISNSISFLFINFYNGKVVIKKTTLLRKESYVFKHTLSYLYFWKKSCIFKWTLIFSFYEV